VHQNDMVSWNKGNATIQNCGQIMTAMSVKRQPSCW